MPKFRQKPVVIEAFQMTLEHRTDNRDWPQWMHEAWQKQRSEVGSLSPIDRLKSNGTDELAIHTLEGIHRVIFNDWIIRGIKGEIYPCKPDIFEATYEPAE